MTDKDEEQRRIQKAVNNATGVLNNKLRDHQAASDRMIGALSSKLKAAQNTIKQRDATIRGKDAEIADLKRDMANMRFACGAIK
jgi:chromosome segregation ATPase